MSFDRFLQMRILNPLAMHDSRALMVKAREVKEQLSVEPEIRTNALLSTGEVVDVPTNSRDFAQMTQPLVDKTLTACRKALSDANLKPRDLDGVVMMRST